MRAAEFVHSRTLIRPSVGVVLGSGLGAFAGSLTSAVRIPYREIPDFPVSTAAGHAGELVVGTLGANGRGTNLAVMSGRFHLYEGYTARQVTCGIRLFHQLEIGRVVLTNAAGGINLLVGPLESGPRFPDMTEAYPSALRELARETAEELGIELYEGVYAAMLGPSYETPAEIRFLKTIGADLVGMSTVAECIAANQLGMEVLGISCVTNLAAGLSGQKLNHEEVLEIGRKVSGTFLRLLTALLPKLETAAL
jgi:purine-nucleoside phosphorylase